MKSHFSLLVRFFLAWLLTFLVGKLAFFVHNGWPGFADALQIYWHGLPLDIAVAAYLTAPPGVKRGLPSNVAHVKTNHSGAVR